MALPAAASAVAGGNETLSSTETVAGAQMLDEVDGTSLDAPSAPPTLESFKLLTGMDFEPAPGKIQRNQSDKKWL